MGEPAIPRSLARPRTSRALNKEMHFLQDMGCESVQLIDVLPPYNTDMWRNMGQAAAAVRTALQAGRPPTPFD